MIDQLPRHFTGLFDLRLHTLCCFLLVTISTSFILSNGTNFKRYFEVAVRPAFNSGIVLELDLIPSLIPGIGMGMGINF